MEAKRVHNDVNKLVLVVGKRRAYLVEHSKGKRYKIASFGVDGVKWWRELFGTFEIDGSWSNWEMASKAYIFAKVYPYVRSPATFVKLLREMEEFESVYWALIIERFGLKAVHAFKRLFEV